MKNPPRLGEIAPDVLPFRRVSFFGTVAGFTFLGTWLFYRLLKPGGIHAREEILLFLFVLLFSQIAYGSALALFGFFQWLRGGDPLDLGSLVRLDKSPRLEGVATAVVMPIFNEPVGRVFAAIEKMFLSLREEGYEESFDFFILSDSNDPAVWIEEEKAWFHLCQKLGAFGKIFYRKRRLMTHGKSGNIADFCRRWGRRYRYMIVLDADSIMTGKLLVRLVAAMEANPRAGIIQTAPKLVRGRSLFRRIQQFSFHLCAPLFFAGSHFWQLPGGTYWGHNAIIRLEPFMRHCDLPDLPGPGKLRLHIMSHDTVEAALMRKAGYQIWFAYAEDGSYEEGPTHWIESLGRDRRWCQGNLQHFWFLFAPSIPFSSRVHIYLGLMSYLSSPLWLVFILLSTWEAYRNQRFAVLSSLIDSYATLQLGHTGEKLLALTVTLLFLPKFLGMIRLFSLSSLYGGPLSIVVSSLLESLFWAIVAPVQMLFYTGFVGLALLGQKIPWRSPGRSESGGISWRDAWATFGPVSLVGACATIAVWHWIPFFFWVLSPIVFAWTLAVPVAWVTGSVRLGEVTRRLGLFLIPEELSPPKELLGLDVGLPVEGQSDGVVPYRWLAQVILDPYCHALHLLLLRRPKSGKEKLRARYGELARVLVQEGPEKLSARERWALLWDAETVARLHETIWTLPSDRLAPYWRMAIEAFQRKILQGLAASLSTSGKGIVAREQLKQRSSEE